MSGLREVCVCVCAHIHMITIVSGLQGKMSSHVGLASLRRAHIKTRMALYSQELFIVLNVCC